MKAPDIEGIYKQAIPFLSLLVGMILKTGRDLLNKRKLTLLQRMGVYMIMIGGGFLGWWICMLLQYDINNPRVPIIITVVTYLAEDISTWIMANWRSSAEKLLTLLIRK